ncbi:MAG TPA: hemerythrin domain-containing protein [Burkholderiales bacterium]|nr:hemerythrin domain-containing protein [Burkholderiales bacterium]
MIQILKDPGPSFDEPLEMLAACHERIEDRLATLERLSAHLAAKGSDAEARAAAQSILRYFDTSGAFHHQDEDEDLFPLLRARAAERSRDDLCGLIDELGREHVTMTGEWQRLREELAGITQGEARLDAEGAVRFAGLYRRHMQRETAAVLPFAREALTLEERSRLGERMAARRKTAR